MLPIHHQVIFIVEENLSNRKNCINFDSEHIKYLSFRLICFNYVEYQLKSRPYKNGNEVQKGRYSKLGLRKVIVRTNPEVNEDEESLYLYVCTKKSISLSIYNFSP